MPAPVRQEKWVLGKKVKMLEVQEMLCHSEHKSRDTNTDEPVRVRHRNKARI